MHQISSITCTIVWYLRSHRSVKTLNTSNNYILTKYSPCFEQVLVQWQCHFQRHTSHFLGQKMSSSATLPPRHTSRRANSYSIEMEASPHETTCVTILREEPWGSILTPIYEMSTWGVHCNDSMPTFMIGNKLNKIDISLMHWNSLFLYILVNILWFPPRPQLETTI